MFNLIELEFDLSSRKKIIINVVLVYKNIFGMLERMSIRVFRSAAAVPNYEACAKQLWLASSHKAHTAVEPELQSST
jgi:hypothetical protein